MKCFPNNEMVWCLKFGEVDGHTICFVVSKGGGDALP
jgi:hypothetical protein